MQSMQKWKYPEMVPSTREWCLGMCIWGSCGYIKHKDLRLWPHGYRICITARIQPQINQIAHHRARTDSPERLQVLTDKNVDVICNVMRKPGGKNADWMPDRGQHVSVTAQENLKLIVFLFHNWWRCTLDWKVSGVWEDTLHLMAGQKKLKQSGKIPTW